MSMLPNDSNKLCKKIHLNDSDNSQSSFTSSLSSSSSSTTSSSSKLSQKIRLQKSFYNKDALESVTKSLLTIDETTDQIKYNTIIKKSRTNSDNINHIQSSSLLTNHLNQSFDSAIRTNSKQALDSDLISSIKNIEPSSSCTKFLDLLLTEPTVITPSISSSSSASSPLSSSNSSINFKTLPAAKKLIKRLSIKSNSSTLQFGVKFINKVLTKNSSTQSIPADLNENKMHKPLNTDLFLPSKKLRKLLPFNHGIKNHGNTCFINCVLQSLFHSSPLLNFFLTNQFEKTTRHIQSQGYFNGKQGTQFLLSKHMYRLLASLWQNSYDSNYSAELKQAIGYLNPTFAGINQNDSHEFCLWLLDRLNEELTFKIEDFARGELKTTSIIEQLFKIEFKSTVTCSKCNYKSSKLETDMMLSLPLPQVDELTPKLPRDHIYRRSLYCHLILTNENSIRKLNDEQVGNGKSKFYTDLDDRCFKVPFLAKIGVNVLLSKVNGKFEESDNKINPTFQDLRFYLQENFQYLNTKNLVFLQMGKINKIIRDSEQIRDVFFPNLSLETQASSPLYIFEMNDDESLSRRYVHGDPMIKIILINSYDDVNLEKYNVCYGLPFAININRDCSYSELCKMILESQSKFFKDKNINKYGSLAKELFKVLIIRGDTNELVRLDPSAEYPLFTDSIEKSINEIVKHSNVTEHIRLLIKWRSYDEISNFIRETDSTLVDYIHKTAHRLFDLDESDSHQQHTESPKSYINKLITLNDCFDMYTQSEELSDDNSWTCTKCKRQTNASKKLNISTLPPILIIHLKRFFYESKSSNFKLTTPVWFPVVNLDLSSYVRADDDSNYNNLNDSYYSDKSSDSSVNSQYIYDLYAVCNHKGQNMANGHYTAFCKNPVDTKWYNFDDSNCIPMSDTNINFQNSIFNNGSSNIFTENAYILFYKRRNCMKNEKWWVNYIDRSLKDYNEFDYFYHNYDIITEKQNEQQNREQKKFLKSQFQSKVTGHRKRLDTDDFMKPTVFNDNYTYEINHYDEFNRPKRLSVKQNSSPNKFTNSNSPSLDSNTTTSSSNFLNNFEESQLSNRFSKNVNISNDILNYPNDNEYVYQSAYNIPSNSNVILNQVYYPQSNFMYSKGQNYTSVSPSPYNISSIQRPTNLNVNQTARRYVNPKSIETPI